MNVEGADTILPVSYDVLWTVYLVLGIALAATAAMRWKRTPLSGTAAVLWFMVILLIPVLGPIAFLVWSRPRGARLR